jgi:REP element-mobilizing transposase RayT
MSVRTLHDIPNELYFCTFTCTNWLSLFEITQSYDEVYKWFGIAHEKNFRTCAFVIMPNHLHFIMATPFRNSNLNTLVSNGKRFLAYAIVDRLKNSGFDHILKQLANEVTPSNRKRGKLHQVFEPSFDARPILDEKMLIQKINYLHHNPVRGRWNLVSDFVLYKHSSAAFYELGTPCLFPITHYSKILHGDI